MLVDTHCHLDFDRFDADRNEVIERAVESDVLGMIIVGIAPDSWKTTADLCAGSSRLWRTVGLHPNSVAQLWNGDLERALRRELDAAEVVGVGESGIDLYRSRESLTLQQEAFEAHIRLAAETDLPIVIHQRDAEDEVLDALRGQGSVKGVMHCFGGDWEFARRCLDLGLHLGIGGVATYKSAAATREALAQAPLERLVLETDAPFLAPQPVRGKRNEPAFLTHVVQTLAACRNACIEEIAEATTANAVRLFGLKL